MDRPNLLFKTLSGVPVSPPVWTADISYWISGNQKSDLQSESGYLNFCNDLGCMPYYWYDAFWAGERTYGDDIQVVHGNIDDQTGELTTKWIVSTKESRDSRSLSKVDRFSTNSWSEATIKHAVASADDLKGLIKLYESSPLVPTDALTGYSIRRNRWDAYGGFPCIGLPRSPVSAFINEWAGVQNGLILMFDEPDLCKTLFAIMEEQEQPIIEECIKINVGLVHFPDNLTSEVYTSIFDTTMRECYERRLAKLHDGGICAAVHLDGTVRGLLPKLSETGIDAVEAVTPHPVGDCTAAEMRSFVSNNQTVLWGGVPGAMFARPYTWLDMKRHVEEVLKAWEGTPFVLGVADQVPPDGDIETVRRITDLLTSSK